MKFLYTILLFSCLLLPFIGKGQSVSLIQATKSDSINRKDSDSLKQGAWFYYFPGGETKEEVIYKNNRKNGLYLSYYRWPNCFKMEANYRNDTLDGTVIYYHRNCKIKLVQNYRDGIRNGYERRYSYKGILIQEAIYDRGKLKKIKTISDKSTIVSSKKKEEDKSLDKYVQDSAKLTDSSVMNVLSRLNLTENTLVVADVTGSMYKNLGDMLLWFRQNLSETPLKRFVFFNDGDHKHTFEKKVGKTGGIYTIQTHDLEDLKEKIEEAIGNGDGGDLPENNVEGMLKGMKKFRHTDQIVLIADRFSAVRDIALLYKVKVPVQVILCGNFSFTNVNYLDIAYQTKGSLQRINGEIKDRLLAMQENDTIEIDGLSYQLKHGHFRRMLTKKLVNEW